MEETECFKMSTDAPEIRVGVAAPAGRILIEPESNSSSLGASAVEQHLEQEVESSRLSSGESCLSLRKGFPGNPGMKRVCGGVALNVLVNQITNVTVEVKSRRRIELP